MIVANSGDSKAIIVGNDNGKIVFSKLSFSAAHKKKRCSQLKQTIEKQADAINLKSSVVKFIYVVYKC